MVRKKEVHHPPKRVRQNKGKVCFLVTDVNDLCVYDYKVKFTARKALVECSMIE